MKDENWVQETVENVLVGFVPASFLVTFLFILVVQGLILFSKINLTKAFVLNCHQEDFEIVKWSTLIWGIMIKLHFFLEGRIY